MPTKRRDQDSAPLMEALEEYHRKDFLPFTVPGHKCGKGASREVRELLGPRSFAYDIPMLVGADDRKESGKVLQKAQDLAAQAYGADQCLFSTNGTSLSVHAAMCAVADRGDTVLVARNCHKSMTAALIIAQARPVFLEPCVDQDWDLAHGVDPAHLEETLQRHPDAKGVFIVSPDYYGVAADVKALADVCHRHGKPLIVDEAWGPHFPFHEGLPPHAIACGADMAMGSMHKTMTALGQASVYLTKGKRIDQDRFKKAFDLFETTSYSTLIMASMDASRRQMVREGQELWSRAIALADDARATLAGVEGLRVMGPEVTGKPGAFALDRTKLTLDVKGLGISGFAAGDWLWDEKRIGVELADHRRLMALVTVADDRASLERFVVAVRDLAVWARKEGAARHPYVALPPEHRLAMPCAKPPCDAYFARARSVRLEDAVGHIAAEMVSPYPPGIPRIMPGQVLTKDVVEYLRLGRDAGMFQMDAQDPKLAALRVLET